MMTMPDDQPPQYLQTQCCITGGGPAGMMLGFLLARAGVDVLVLEKHADFLRDFRGDTVHPSTLEALHELGLLDDFLKRPHQEARQLTGYISDVAVTIADFTHLPVHCPFIVLMPQWDFLDFLVSKAQRYPTFHLKMQAEVVDLIENQGRIVGVRATTPDGPLEVRAPLTVAADGRHSTVRDRAKLAVDDLGAPIDVLWMRLSRQGGDPSQPLGRFDHGQILIMIDRGDYWQCGYVIAKGGIDAIRQRGLDAFRARIAEAAPFVRDRVDELRTWDDIKLLTVKVDRLRQWSRPGLLCIGDSAHAMSPVGGVGINLAIQDAIATANLLAEPLRNNAVTPADLRKVQRRRSLPTRLTQRMQVVIQNRILGRVLASQIRPKLPLVLKLLRRWPYLRRFPARLVGLGVRPEHIKTPDLLQTEH
ncbi:MAG: FAD-dependent oxidoreductase [Isosphaeraceae bacterium]